MEILTGVKPGSETNEFRFVAGGSAVTLLLALMQVMPPVWAFHAVAAMACVFILVRGLVKLELPGDKASTKTSEFYIFAGAFVTQIAGAANDAVSPTAVTAWSGALFASFCVSRVIAKHDWIGMARRVFSRELSTFDAVKIANHVILRDPVIDELRELAQEKLKTRMRIPLAAPPTPRTADETRTVTA